ncbi:hypothetical protein [Synechococcus sp. M16CYN]|uniref:hypothetical protein n=1 Tax=Synechococcus sp. M16CYN TaxID=3103139 RepID=UPI0030E0F46B
MVPILMTGAIVVSFISSSQESKVLKSLCLTAFTAAMARAGETPPQGMGEETCTCFLNEFANGVRVDLARKACKQRVVDSYQL